MLPLLRIGDIGDGVCRAGHPGVPKGSPKAMTTTLVTASPNVFANNKNAASVGAVGSTDCGHTTEAITGRSTVFINFKNAHALGSVGVVSDSGGGDYTAITGSSTVLVGDSTPVVVPAVNINPAVQAAINKQTANYVANPNNYAVDSDQQVKGNFAGTPNDGGAGSSLIDPTAAAAGDIAPFLAQLLTEAANGTWRETGQSGKSSNPNITGIWKELGYPSSGAWLTDQTAWCMGFVNYVLKRTGYRFVQTAWALDITTSKFKATQIPLDQGQPGDVALWSYRHVNFIYTGSNGRYTFVGGNQSPKASNNPNDGDVTQSWPSGYRVPGNGSLVSLWRPSRE